jgi:hypothetical protein
MTIQFRTHVGAQHAAPQLGKMSAAPQFDFSQSVEVSQ